MGHFIKIYLAATGVGTLICLFAPGIVAVGLFLLIPGVVLSVMPTAFLWGCIFAALWFPLHGSIGDAPAAAAAILGTALLVWMLPLPSQLASQGRLAEAVRPDIVPAAPIKIAGHVRIDMPYLLVEPQDRASRGGVSPVRCNSLCAAALFMPGVDTVTLNDAKDRTEAAATGMTAIGASARTFRRVPKSECSETLRPIDATGFGLNYDEVRATEALWNLRLSASDCIVAVPTRTQFDLVIATGSYVEHDTKGGGDWATGARPVTVRRIEVRRGDGQVLLRLLKARTSMLLRPLNIWFSGGFESLHFGWARRDISNGPTSPEPELGEVLGKHSDLVTRADPAETARLARQHLAVMLADPSVTADDAGWSAAEGYFAQLHRLGVEDSDRRLVSALIADRRMTRFRGIWEAVRVFGDRSAELRDAMVDRLAHPGPADDKDVWQFMNVIEQLPPGTFATPTPAELALLADPAARQRAPGLIARQADRGTAATPLLADIAESHARSWAVTRAGGKVRSDDRNLAVLDATRVAICRIGPDAAPILPRLMALYDTGALPRADLWVLTLARLGQPIAHFVKPNGIVQTQDQFEAGLRRKLARFNVERDCTLG